jgi:hypothetical protein
MNDLDDAEAIERLRRVGFTASDIERLRGLRRYYGGDEQAQVFRRNRYPTFVRWLVRILKEGTPISASRSEDTVD